MAAPRRVELDEDELVVGDRGVKVLLGEDEHAALLGDLGVGQGHEGRQGQTQEALHVYYSVLFFGPLLWESGNGMGYRGSRQMEYKLS